MSSFVVMTFAVCVLLRVLCARSLSPRTVMSSFVLVISILTLSHARVWSQTVSPLHPKFILTFSQFTTGAKSVLSAEVKTTFQYPCAGFGIELDQAYTRDTIVVTIGAFLRPNPCLQIDTEATGRLMLGPLDNGSHVLKVQYRIWSDIYHLTIQGGHFSFRSANATFTNIVALPGTSATDSIRQMEQKPIKIFIDCSPDCYQDFLKTDLTSFDYVRDKELANIHLLITSQPAGNRGQRVTLTFIGMNEFSGLTDTTSFGTQATDTDDIIRHKLVRSIKAGIVRYVARTSLGENMEISFQESNAQTPPEDDPWNNWVFNADLSAELNGQKSAQAIKFSGSFYANRITDEWKVKLGTSASYTENVFTIARETYRSIARGESLTGLAARSLDDHWSVGGFFSLSSSTYDNTRLSLTIAPALEYNVFRYAESTRRECRLLYRIGVNRLNYFSETIFFCTDETLGGHSLSLAFGMSEPWGRASVELQGSQYLHDLSKNRLEFSGDLSVRVLEGLSVRIFGVLSLIHDQLSLPALDATPEEILLQRRELETTYSYYTGIGVSYTFGSIFSNIVNPRFGK